MARPDAWMPFYWAAFWKDTNGLSAVEQCAYFNLLGAMWNEGGTLPNDNARLQRMSRVTEKEWRSVSATVVAYFDCIEGRLTQKRLGEEYAKALKAYTGRSQHIATVNSNRKQSLPTDTEDTIHNSQSPKRENLRPRKRGTTISPDWIPNEQDTNHATDRNVDPKDIPSIAEHFRDYHTAKGTSSKDWAASWRTWITNHLRFTAAGSGGKQSARGKQNAGSIGEVVARLKSEADFQGQNNGGVGLGQGSGWVRNHEPGPGNDHASRDDGGTIIDADDAERMFRASGGTEISDDCAA